MTTTAKRPIDLKALAKDLNDLRDELRQDLGQADLDHLKKMERWGRLCTALGYGTGLFLPNPISAYLISQGKFTRWAMIAHHVCHRGYDKVPDVPERFTSKAFAKGWRRVVDWLDWMHPDAWSHEHNTLHHYKLGEDYDPDQPERNLDFLRESGLPMPLRYAFVAIGAMTWKPLYYAPNTMRELHKARLRRAKQDVEGQPDFLFDKRVWLPWHEPGKSILLECWLPYIGFYFVLLPAMASLLNPWFGLCLLLNVVMAEIMTNIHAFIVIVPNHAGDDVYRFDTPIDDREEFYLRQIVGSVNYRCGSNLVDFMHGWLNYQIEHHIWPDMSMLQYQKAHPKVKAICEKHGVPYVQEPVLKRVKKLVDVMVGKTSMKWWNTETNTPSDSYTPPSRAAAAPAAGVPTAA